MKKTNVNASMGIILIKIQSANNAKILDALNVLTRHLIAVKQKQFFFLYSYIIKSTFLSIEINRF